MTKEQSKTKGKEGKGKGWREPPDPDLGKAKRHHEVALRAQGEGAINEPIETAKSEAETEEFHLTVNPKKLMTLKEYCDENKIGFRVDESFDAREEGAPAVYLRVPEPQSAAFHDYLNKNEIVEGVFEDDTTNKASKVVVFQHEKLIPTALLTEFCKEYKADLNEDEKRKKISINKNSAGSLQEFMSEHGIELKEIKDDEMEQEHLATISEEIVEEVQSKRSPAAVAKDNAQTAKQIGRKENADDLLKWVKDPGKSDLAGVDTKGAAE